MHKFILAPLMVALLAAGCTTHREFREIDNEASGINDEASAINDQNNALKRSPVVITSDNWINRDPVPVSEAGKALPACWPQINQAGNLSLDDIASLISDICHIAVQIMPDARGSISTSSDSSTQAVKGKLPLPGQDSHGRTPLTSAGSGSSSSQPLTMGGGASVSGLRWNGSLAGLLDHISSSTGVSWRYTGQEIQLYRLETRTFQLAVLNADTSMNSQVIGGTSSASGSSESGNSLSGNQKTTQQTAVTVSTKVYDDIRLTVNGMLSPGGRAFLSPGSASLTVTDTPQVLRSVSEYISRQNAILDRQVTLKVDVYRITFKDTKQLGIDWSMVYGSAKKMGYSLSSSFTNASMDIASAAVTSSSGYLSGSEVLIKALNSQANIAAHTTNTTTTTNMVPVPLQVAKQTTYLAKTKTTTSEDYSSTELTPGEITTGLSMTVLPYVRDNGTIQLQMSFSLSDEPTITTMTAADGNTSIQMPSTDVRSITQRANLQAGQTLVMNGFQSLYDESNMKGTTSKSWWGFGGGEDASRSRAMLLIMVTPVLSNN